MGCVDVVSVSNFNIPEDVELTPLDGFGSPFDPGAQTHLSFLPEPRTQELVWVGSTFTNGTLSVEISDGANGNGWLEVRTVGTVGLTSGASTPDNLVEAVVRVLDRFAAVA